MIASSFANLRVNHIVESDFEVAVRQIGYRFDSILRCSPNQSWQQNAGVVVVNDCAERK